MYLHKIILYQTYLKLVGLVGMYLIKVQRSGQIRGVTNFKRTRGKS